MCVCVSVCMYVVSVFYECVYDMYVCVICMRVVHVMYVCSLCMNSLYVTYGMLCACVCA